MYETLMHTLRSFFGQGIMRNSLTLALVVVILGLAFCASPIFRRSLAATREQAGWKGGLSSAGTGLYKFLVFFLLVRLFITVLMFQGQVFGQQHGRLTDKNRSAVLMKWGYPHEQRELSVTHSRKRTWVTRQILLVEGEKERVFSESYWEEDEAPIQSVQGKIPTLISRKEEIKEVPVPQKSIVSADVGIVVKNNPRTLGNANYAGYNDEWHFRYVVTNRSEFATTARLSFPLPAKTGLFDKMVLRVDGHDWLSQTQSENNGVKWYLSMPSKGDHLVEIEYRSRGLEHLRYIPKRMTQTGHYRVAMTVMGIASEDLDYPIGSMPPEENLSEITSRPYTLHWTLDNALTSYDIGIKLPVAEQPSYHFARLLQQAPAGIVLLLVVLAVPRLILGSAVRPSLLAVLGTGYCLHFTFMGRLADMLPGFAWPFVLSAAVLVIITAWFRFRDCEAMYFRLHDTAVFTIAIVLFPLSIIDAETTALWAQIFCLAVLTHFSILLVLQRARPPESRQP